MLIAFVWLGRGLGQVGERLPRGSLLAALGIAFAGLLPSSFLLWRFGYDRFDRLLHPALPAAALVVCGNRRSRDREALTRPPSPHQNIRQ